MKFLPSPCFYPNFYPNVSSYGLVLQTVKFHKKKYLLIIRTQLGLKNTFTEKNKMLLQCSYSCKFPASSIFSSAGWRWRYPVVARSRFSWKLHPSSQAWQLLSTSNRGETVIAKCGNLNVWTNHPSFHLTDYSTILPCLNYPEHLALLADKNALISLYVLAIST